MPSTQRKTLAHRNGQALLRPYLLGASNARGQGNRPPRPPFYIDVKRPDDRIAGLLFTVFLRMSLACMLSVIACVGGVTVGAVSMMRRFLVMPALVVFSCLSMVPRSF